MRWLHCTLLLLVLNGCAGNLPRAIVEPPEHAVTVAQVQQAPDRYRGEPVRWGGEVIEVQNLPDHTDVLVLGRELKKGGEPREDGVVYGRFIARFGGFLDPARLPEGRMLTVSGTLAGVETRKVGEFPYRYPVVEVTAWHLWPEPEPRVYYPDPWGPWYPYYHPWRPWGYPWWW